MVPDIVMNRINVVLEIAGSGKGLGAESPITGRTRCRSGGWSHKECWNIAIIVRPGLHLNRLLIPERLWLCGPCVVINWIHLILEALWFWHGHIVACIAQMLRQHWGADRGLKLEAEIWREQSFCFYVIDVIRPNGRKHGFGSPIHDWISRLRR